MLGSGLGQSRVKEVVDIAFGIYGGGGGIKEYISRFLFVLFFVAF